MAPEGSPKRPRRSWTPYVILAAMLLLTAGAAYYTSASARSKDRIRFEAAANRVTEVIRSRMDTYIATATAGVGLYAASKSVELSEFHDFAATIDVRRRYPGMQGLGFVARVRDKDALIQSMREQGAADFKLWPDRGAPAEAAARYAVTSMEPLDAGNKAFIGYDMASDPALLAAMDRARDTGMPAASTRVMLATESENAARPGFVIFVPVYKNNTPHGSADERRAALEGFVVCPFYAEDLFARMLAAGGDPEVELEIFDDPSIRPSSRLYPSGAGFLPPFDPSLHYFTSINVGGQPWSAVFQRRPGAETSSDFIGAPLVFATGALVSLLLFGLSRIQSRARALAEHAATELARSEQSLREGEQNLRDVLDGLFVFVGVMSPDGTLLEANKTLRASSGGADLALGEPFERAPWWAYSDEARGELRAAIARAAEGEVARFDAKVKIDGDRFMILDFTIAPLIDAEGKVQKLIPSGVDITARVSSERERARLNEEIISMQSRLLSELSAPLIPLSEDIVLMPLIGALDEARAKQVEEALANGVASRKAKIAVLDVTGVQAVGTEVAGALVKTAQVVRMLGAEVVLTGLRPAVAQTIVQMGIDLQGLVTRGDLQGGLDYALRARSGRSR